MDQSWQGHRGEMSESSEKPQRGFCGCCMEDTLEPAHKWRQETVQKLPNVQAKGMAGGVVERPMELSAILG